MNISSLRDPAQLGWVRASALALRRLSRRSGVTDEEFFGSLPGDDVLAHPMWTRFAEMPLGLVDHYHVSTMFSGIARRVESSLSHAGPV